MVQSEEKALRSAAEYWNCEGLIAEEQGDDEQAQEYFYRAEVLVRRASALSVSAEPTAASVADA